MFRLSSSENFRKWAIPGCLGILLFAIGPSSQAGPPAESSARDSVSIGTPMKGSLKRGQVLPKKGAGYRMLKTAQERRARFGILELVMAVKDAAHKVRRKHKGSILWVGDLSARKGGKIDHHGSHQSGRDVDLIFYMKDRQGKQVSVDQFIPFDKNGFSVDPPMEYRFDAARNWDLVAALIESRHATIQWIFVATHLEKLMLAHAEAKGARASTRRKAKQILHQPGKKAHWDHFHVRVYCPAGDKPSCKEVGPRWAWTR